LALADIEQNLDKLKSKDTYIVGSDILHDLTKDVLYKPIT
jgi:hypothetical protein